MTSKSFTKNEHVIRGRICVLTEINLLFWVVIIGNFFFFFNRGRDRQLPQEDVRSKS